MGVRLVGFLKLRSIVYIEVVSREVIRFVYFGILVGW